MRTAQVSPQPQYWRGKEFKKKKEKRKSSHFDVLLSNRICGGNNLGKKE